MTANLAPPPVSDLLNHRGLDVVESFVDAKIPIPEDAGKCLYMDN